jgi:hypothetical protein
MYVICADMSMTRRQASLQTATRQERNLRIFPMITFALCAVRIRTLSPLQIKGGFRIFDAIQSPSKGEDARKKHPRPFIFGQVL